MMWNCHIEPENTTYLSKIPNLAVLKYGADMACLRGSKEYRNGKFKFFKRGIRPIQG